MTDYLPRGTALIGPHGEIAEYIGTADYLGAPGVRIRRCAGKLVVPASSLHTEWHPAPGRVVDHYRDTGRWTTPWERTLEIDPHKCGDSVSSPLLGGT